METKVDKVMVDELAVEGSFEDKVTNLAMDMSKINKRLTWSGTNP